MTQKQLGKTLLMLLVIILLLLTLVFESGIYFTYATEVNFDKTNALDDLLSSTVNGKPFDIREYPFDESKSLKVINIVEYCYSYKVNMRANYGLYIYIYNPQGLDIRENAGQNKVQLAVPQGNKEPVYNKYNLQFISKSSGNYEGLFYKFKVVDKETNGKLIVEQVNSNERVYNISGIELLTNGNTNATEYGIGGIYKFSGYAKGYGPHENAESTLTAVVEDLETLELSIRHTYFRTNISSAGKDHYNQVSTVYFSVPEYIFEDYGYLQKIRAEWWEYKTQPAVVTSNKDFYNQAIKYTGVDVGEYDSSVPIDMFIYTTSYYENVIYKVHEYALRYNYKFTEMQNNIFRVNTTMTIMPMVFYAPVENTTHVFDFLFSQPIAGSVSGTTVSNYLYDYTNNLGHGYIDCNGRKISKDLFTSTVDSGRTRGYNDKTIDLSDSFDLDSYDSNHSWWDKLWDYGFSWPATSGNYKDISPIYVLESSDLAGSNSAIAQSLLVNENDVTTLKQYYTAETAKGNKVVLFRFANTDYYSAEVSAYYNDTYAGKNTYVAQQTVFLDFDIIELTFNKDGIYKVIPAVSSPTDIISGFTPPIGEFNWLRALLAILALILLIIVITPLLPTVISAIIWLVKLPIKGIASIISHFKNK